MLTDQNKIKPKRHTKLCTVYTLSAELAEEYIKKSYAERKDLIIHYTMPSSYTGYDVCFSYEVDE